MLPRHVRKEAATASTLDPSREPTEETVHEWLSHWPRHGQWWTGRTEVKLATSNQLKPNNNGEKPAFSAILKGPNEELTFHP